MAIRTGGVTRAELHEARNRAYAKMHGGKDLTYEETLALQAEQGGSPFMSNPAADPGVWNPEIGQRQAWKQGQGRRPRQEEPRILPAGDPLRAGLEQGAAFRGGGVVLSGAARSSVQAGQQRLEQERLAGMTFQPQPSTIGQSSLDRVNETRAQRGLRAVGIPPSEETEWKSSERQQLYARAAERLGVPANQVDLLLEQEGLGWGTSASLADRGQAVLEYATRRTGAPYVPGQPSVLKSRYGEVSQGAAFASSVARHQMMAQWREPTERAPRAGTEIPVGIGHVAPVGSMLGIPGVVTAPGGEIATGAVPGKMAKALKLGLQQHQLFFQGPGVGAPQFANVRAEQALVPEIVQRVPSFVAFSRTTEEGAAYRDPAAFGAAQRMITRNIPLPEGAAPGLKIGQQFGRGSEIVPYAGAAPLDIGAHYRSTQVAAQDIVTGPGGKRTLALQMAAQLDPSALVAGKSAGRKGGDIARTGLAEQWGTPYMVGDIRDIQQLGAGVAAVTSGEERAKYFPGIDPGFEKFGYEQAEAFRSYLQTPGVVGERWSKTPGFYREDDPVVKAKLEAGMLRKVRAENVPAGSFAATEKAIGVELPLGAQFSAGWQWSKQALSPETMEMVSRVHPELAAQYEQRGARAAGPAAALGRAYLATRGQGNLETVGVRDVAGRMGEISTTIREAMTGTGIQPGTKEYRIESQRELLKAVTQAFPGKGIEFQGEGMRSPLVMPTPAAALAYTGGAQRGAMMQDLPRNMAMLLQSAIASESGAYFTRAQLEGKKGAVPTSPEALMQQVRQEQVGLAQSIYGGQEEVTGLAELTASSTFRKRLWGGHAGGGRFGGQVVPARGLPAERWAGGPDVLRQMMLTQGIKGQGTEDLIRNIMTGKAEGPRALALRDPFLSEEQAKAVLSYMSPAEYEKSGLGTAKQYMEQFGATVGVSRAVGQMGGGDWDVDPHSIWAATTYGRRRGGIEARHLAQASTAGDIWSAARAHPAAEVQSEIGKVRQGSTVAGVMERISGMGTRMAPEEMASAIAGFQETRGGAGQIYNVAKRAMEQRIQGMDPASARARLELGSLALTAIDVTGQSAGLQRMMDLAGTANLATGGYFQRGIGKPGFFGRTPGELVGATAEALLGTSELSPETIAASLVDPQIAGERFGSIVAAVKTGRATEVMKSLRPYMEEEGRFSVAAVSRNMPMPGYVMEQAARRASAQAGVMKETAGGGFRMYAESQEAAAAGGRGVAEQELTRFLSRREMPLEEAIRAAKGYERLPGRQRYTERAMGALGLGEQGPRPGGLVSQVLTGPRLTPSQVTRGAAVTRGQAAVAASRGVQGRGLMERMAQAETNRVLKQEIEAKEAAVAQTRSPWHGVMRGRERAQAAAAQKLYDERQGPWASVPAERGEPRSTRMPSDVLGQEEYARQYHQAEIAARGGTTYQDVAAAEAPLPIAGGVGAPPPPTRPPVATAAPPPQPSGGDPLARAVQQIVEGGKGGFVSVKPSGEFFGRAGEKIERFTEDHMQSLGTLNKRLEQWSKAVLPVIESGKDLSKGQVKLTEDLAKQAKGFEGIERAAGRMAEGPARQEAKRRIEAIRAGGQLGGLQDAQEAIGQQRWQESLAGAGGGGVPPTTRERFQAWREGRPLARGAKKMMSGWELMRLQRMWGMTGAPTFQQYIPAAAEAGLAGWGASAAIGGTAAGAMPGGVAGGVMAHQAAARQSQIEAGRRGYMAYGTMPQMRGLQQLQAVAGPAVGAGLVAGGVAGMFGLSAMGVGLPVAGALGAAAGRNYLMGMAAEAPEQQLAMMRERQAAPGYGRDFLGRMSLGYRRAGPALGAVLGGQMGVGGLAGGGEYQQWAAGQAGAGVGIAGAPLGELGAGDRAAALSHVALQLREQKQWAGFDESQIMAMLQKAAPYAPELGTMSAEQVIGDTPDVLDIMRETGRGPEQYEQLAGQLGMGPTGAAGLQQMWGRLGGSQEREARWATGRRASLKAWGATGEEIAESATPQRISTVSERLDEMAESLGITTREMVALSGELPSLAERIGDIAVAGDITVGAEPIAPISNLGVRRRDALAGVMQQRRMLGMDVPEAPLTEEAVTAQYGQLPMYQAQAGMAQRLAGMGADPYAAGRAAERLGSMGNIQAFQGLLGGDPRTMSLIGQRNVQGLFDRSVDVGGGQVIDVDSLTEAFTGALEEVLPQSQVDAMRELMKGLRPTIEADTGLRMGTTQMWKGYQEDWRRGGGIVPRGVDPEMLARYGDIAEERGMRGLEEGQISIQQGRRDFQMQQQEHAMRWQRVSQFGGQFEYPGAGKIDTRGSFAIQKELRHLSRIWEDFTRGYQGQQRQQQYGQFMENWQVRAQRMPTQFGWQREDLAFKGAQSSLQYGWQMEDVQENLRFATGRDRRKLLRQQERATIQYGMGMGQLETQEGRLDTREQWAREDLDRQRRQFEERFALQTEYQEQYKRYTEERRGLEDELQIIREFGAKFSMQQAEERLEKEREVEEQMRAIQQQQRMINQAMQDAVAKQQQVAQLLQWMINGLAADGALGQAWSGMANHAKSEIASIADAFENLYVGSQ